ncbi:MAG TPA: hypothetical protein VGB72_00735 [Acidobacteriota bacterium]
MKRTLPGGLIMLLLCAAALSAAMNNKVTVAHVGGKVRWSQVALGPDGIAHIAFAEELDPDVRSPIYYVSYDGQAASNLTLLTRSYDTFGMQPYIAVSSRGVIAVAWSEPRSDSIFVRVYDPGTKTWLLEERVSNWGVDEPSVVVAPNGNLHVFFYDTGDSRCYVRSKMDGVWERETLVSKPDAVCRQGNVALANDGTVWATWLQRAFTSAGYEFKAHYKKRTASGWEPQSWINEDGLSQERPHIAVGPNNVPWVTWGDTSPEESARIAVCKLDEVGNPLEYITGESTQHFPRIALDTNNNAHLAIPQGPGDGGDGILYKTNTGGGWSAQMMDGPETKCGGISSDGFGNVAVSWSGYYGVNGSDVYINTLEPVSPKYFLAPINLAATVVIGGLKITPKITYNLSWSSNPDNNEQYLSGYRIYMKEGTGSYQLLASVTKSTFSQSYEFDDTTKKRRFAVSTVNLGGAESTLAEF